MWKNFVVQICLLCLYFCCANICFYWRQIPLEADALLCAPRNLFVQTPLTRHRHTPFHIRQPFQNIQHAVERSVLFQIFIGSKSDRCLPCYSLLSAKLVLANKVMLSLVLWKVLVISWHLSDSSAWKPHFHSLATDYFCFIIALKQL